MTDTVVIAEGPEENSGYRFSWGLAFAGGVTATAVTFFLLSLGAGFGLLLVNPVTHAGPSTPTFLTGGAIYFFAAQAFGFVVGGHLAGRLLGPIVESGIQEEFRAAAHGLVAWAVAILATLTVVAVIGMSAANTGATAAALYGAKSGDAKTSEISPVPYWVDVLFRPAANTSASLSMPAPSRAAYRNDDSAQLIPVSQQTTMTPQPDATNPPASTEPSEPSNTTPYDQSTQAPQAQPQAMSPPDSGTAQTSPDTQSAPAGNVSSGTIMPPPAPVLDPNARFEARRILEQWLMHGEQMSADDGSRLIALVAAQVGISPTLAADRINRLTTDVQAKTKRDADTARKAASYVSLWIALSLLFGAILSAFAAVTARHEDDRDSMRVSPRV